MSKVLKDLTKEEFFNNLGLLWHALLILELYIRVCLLEKGKEKALVKIMRNLKRGDSPERNSVFNGDVLSTMIKKFNQKFAHLITLDKKRICELRNAIGHGKILAIAKTPTEITPTKIYNFENRKDNRVKVVYVETMSKAWFKTNIEFVEREVNRVISVYKSLKRKQ